MEHVLIRIKGKELSGRSLTQSPMNDSMNTIIYLQYLAHKYRTQSKNKKNPVFFLKLTCYFKKSQIMAVTCIDT